MAGDVDDRDSGFPLAALQVLDDVEPAFMDVVLDSRLEVEALLEIEKDQEVAAHRAVEGERASINVHSANQGKIPGLRNQITGKDRKSTRLNSSHLGISYAVFCLKKK